MSAPIRRFALALLLAIVAGMAVVPAFATTLVRGDVERELGGRFIVGEMPAALPIWPLYQRAGTDPNEKPRLSGYAYESADIEPVRGYSGKPINLFVAIDLDGNFLDVRLLEHREPLFRTESGNAKIAAFAAQFKGLSVRHQVDIQGPSAATRRDEREAVLHGVQAGTVTARAIEKTVRLSAAQVRELAEAALAGDAQGVRPAQRRRDVEVRLLDWGQMARRGMIERSAFTRAEVERAFAGTRVEGADPEALQRPEEIALQFDVALVSLPQIGQNLFDESGWRRLAASLRGGEALLVIERGALSDALRSRRTAGNSAFVVEQDGKTLPLRTLTADDGLRYPVAAREGRAHLLVIDAATPIDVGQPFSLSYVLQRRYGPFPTMVVEKPLLLEYGFVGWRPALWSWLDAPWMQQWQKRWWEIALLVTALGVLTVALVRQRSVTANARRLARFRIGFLLFTLVCIGWWFQGQLSIVNITASLEALASGNDLAFLLNDPMTVILWIFVFGTLVVWGRGTFCGWLCPFGALQELVSTVMRAVGVRHRRLRQVWDRRLKWIKYGVLAGVLGLMWVSPSATELAVEIEPFKTAISLYFVRDWPYVAWAIGCIALSVFVYRGYCRYICPLGAALAALDPLRRLGWLPRRDACGTPCQTCRHRCEYQSIGGNGKVTYSECFQCLDCVAIMQDDKQCLPLILERKRVIPIQPVQETA